MCKIWGRIRIKIWIGIVMESLIRIRIGLKTMPIHNTVASYVYLFDITSCKESDEKVLALNFFSKRFYVNFFLSFGL